MLKKKAKGFMKGGIVSKDFKYAHLHGGQVVPEGSKYEEFIDMSTDELIEKILEKMKYMVK